MEDVEISIDPTGPLSLAIFISGSVYLAILGWVLLLWSQVGLILSLLGCVSTTGLSIALYYKCKSPAYAGFKIGLLFDFVLRSVIACAYVSVLFAAPFMIPWQVGRTVALNPQQSVAVGLFSFGIVVAVGFLMRRFFFSWLKTYESLASISAC